MKSIAERFWSKVDKSGDCWIWTASKRNRNYGQFWFSGKMEYAHRVSWVIHNGEIPDGEGYHGMCVCHKCDNPSCVRPAHLFLGTNADNIADMFSKGRAVRRSGESHPTAKLNETSVKMIRKYYASGACSQRWLARVYGVANSLICGIVNRKYWSRNLEQPKDYEE